MASVVSMSLEAAPSGAAARRSPIRAAPQATLSVGAASRVTGQSILERVAAGDQVAVTECLDTYDRLVWSLARRYLRNQADAEDAVQEIFIEIWKNAGRYDPQVASEGAFISTITRRRLIDRIRRIQRQPGMDSIDDQIDARQPAVLSTLDDDAEVAKVVQVLQELEPKHREILSMALYEGYSHSEIAKILSMPLGTVKTRVRRGLMQVREKMQLAREVG